MISPPFFSLARQRFLYSSALATITSTGQSRPIPSQPQANMPFSWPMKLAPRCLRILTFATVAGCVYILPSFVRRSSSRVISRPILWTRSKRSARYRFAMRGLSLRIFERAQPMDLIRRSNSLWRLGLLLRESGEELKMVAEYEGVHPQGMRSG